MGPCSVPGTGMAEEDVMVSKLCDVLVEEKSKKGTRSCEVGGKDRNDVAASQGVPGATGSWEKQDPWAEPLAGLGPVDTLIVGFWPV